MDRRYKKKMAAYWLREKKRSISALDQLDFTTWFDYWHIHPDWYSKGNRSAEDRRSVAANTYELLAYCERKLQFRDAPYQVWATVYGDTADNALYIHTENGNGTAFPHEFSGIEWGVSAPEELAGLVNAETHRVGKVMYERGPVYIITGNA